jgi:hypothetical protein
MRPLAVVSVLLVLLLAGCSRPASEATVPAPLASSPGGTCDERFAGAPGNDAMLVSALADDAQVVADRLAAVAGDRVAGAPEALENGEVRFPTDAGNASYWRAGDESWFEGRAEWSGRASWNVSSSREAVSRMLAAFSVPEAWVEVREGPQASFTETYAGETILGTGGWALASPTGAASGLAIGPLYEVRANTEPMTKENATAIARAYAACLWGSARAGDLPADSAGLGAKAGSLTRVILVRDPARASEGHCGVSLHVHVDAVTGAVHGAQPPACD